MQKKAITLYFWDIIPVTFYFMNHVNFKFNKNKHLEADKVAEKQSESETYIFACVMGEPLSTTSFTFPNNENLLHMKNISAKSLRSTLYCVTKKKKKFFKKDKYLTSTLLNHSLFRNLNS